MASAVGYNATKIFNAVGYNAKKNGTKTDFKQSKT